MQCPLIPYDISVSPCKPETVWQLAFFAFPLFQICVSPAIIRTDVNKLKKISKFKRFLNVRHWKIKITQQNFECQTKTFVTKS